MSAYSKLIMTRVRQRFDESGLNLQEFGERMGYPRATARKSAWQFLNATEDPRLSMIEKAALALGIGVPALLEMPAAEVFDRAIAQQVVAIYTECAAEVLSGRVSRYKAISGISQRTDRALSGQSVEVKKRWDMWRRWAGMQIYSGNPKTAADYAANLSRIAEQLLERGGPELS